METTRIIQAAPVKPYHELPGTDGLLGAFWEGVRRYHMAWTSTPAFGRWSKGLSPKTIPKHGRRETLFFFFPGSSLQVWKRVLVYSLAPNKHLYAFAHCCQRSSLSPLIHPGLPCLCTPVTPGELGSYQKAVNHLKHPLTSFCRSSLRSWDKFQDKFSFVRCQS